MLGPRKRGALMLAVASATAVVLGMLPAGARWGSSGGGLDRTFGKQGRVITAQVDTAQSAPVDLVVLPNRKIVVVGTHHPAGQNSGIAIARYRSSGRLDRGFGVDGVRITDLGEGPDWEDFPDENPAAVARHRQGFVVGGSMLPNQAQDPPVFVVIRYTKHGALDHGFGDGGVVAMDSDCEGCHSQLGHDIAVQRDGKIILGGCVQCSGESAFAMIRLHPDGRVDRAFGDGGWVRTRRGSWGDQIQAIHILRSGNIVAAGRMGDSLAVARYRPDGRLDRSFGNDGVVTTAFERDAEAFGVDVHRDGRIVVAGRTRIEPVFDFTRYAVVVLRYRRNGSLDRSFSRDGTAMTTFPHAHFEKGGAATDVRILPGGGTVVVGNAYPYRGAFALAFYRPNGRLDRRVGKKGKITTGFGEERTAGAEAVAVQPDGAIVVAGWSAVQMTWERESYNFTLARYRAPSRR